MCQFQTYAPQKWSKGTSMDASSQAVMKKKIDYEIGSDSVFRDNGLSHAQNRHLDETAPHQSSVSSFQSSSALSIMTEFAKAISI